MKPLLAILLALFSFKPILAEEKASLEDEIILPSSLPQKVYQRYQTNFAHHHDRGFYLSATCGPQWNHSIKKPDAQAFRFGGKLGLGWYVADGVALFGAAWGNFLEVATLVAGGPGIAFLFDNINIGIDFSFGIGRVFNVIEQNDIKKFAETVLAGNLSISKFWWLSGKTCLGASLSSGLHGFTITEGKLSSFGWNVGLGLAFLFG